LGADEDARAKQLDAILAKAVTSGQPGLAVLVKKEGTVLFEKGYGLRRIKARAPITPHTDFRLASVTKQFTAMSVMLLERDGKLRYESTLTEIFPDFPAYGKAITIRHLLTHTSGLPDYEDLMDQEEKSHGKRWSPRTKSRTRKYSRYWKSKPGANSLREQVGLIAIRVTSCSA